MFRFAKPNYLYLLFLVVIIIIFYFYNNYNNKKRLSEFGDYFLITKLIPDFSKKRKHIKFTILCLCLVLIIIILARPQFGSRNYSEEKNGIEIIIAADVSNSMLCRDVYPSRIDRSKMILSKLIDEFDNDRIGIVAFAGGAVTILPITSDYVSAKTYLSQLTPATIKSQGTDMGEGIRCAISSFSTRDDIGKALILITDSEDHEEGAIDAAKEAKEMGINVYVMSVGTTTGGTIPTENGKNKLDSNGDEVITKLNEKIGKEIAEAGDGVYFNIDNTINAEKQLRKEISKLKKASFNSNSFGEGNEQFVVISIILLLLLLLDSCITEKKNTFFNNLNIFK